jgi:hypothetical protein
MLPRNQQPSYEIFVDWQNTEQNANCKFASTQLTIVLSDAPFAKLAHLLPKPLHISEKWLLRKLKCSWGACIDV